MKRPRPAEPPKAPSRRAAASFEQWLRDEVLAGHAEYLADPSQGIPAEDVLARIKARRAAR
jgi:hypothetical protein